MHSPVFAIMLGTALGISAMGSVRAQAPAASGGVGPETFRAGTTGALGRLCGAGISDAISTAGTVYCHGFLSGVGQFHREITRDGQLLTPLFCPPQPPPSVEQAASAFAAWVRANPQHEAEPAIDGLTRFAQHTYPCPTQPAATRRPRSR
jgi:hypothetical protein